ncbi:OTU family cysteine protease, partial [Cardiosporidium cionae]
MLGNEESHRDIRFLTTTYLAEHREEFEYFIEDDEPFIHYVERMSNPSIWAGHLELQILSLIYKVNVLVHHPHEPTYVLCNFPDSAECVQLSYHNVAHYNSVRLLTDRENCVATKLTLEQIKHFKKSLIDGESIEETAIPSTAEVEIFSIDPPLSPSSSKKNTVAAISTSDALHVYTESEYYMFFLIKNMESSLLSYFF